MSRTFAPFKRTAASLFQPTASRMKHFQTWDSNKIPAYHDVSEVPSLRPPTAKVFKAAMKNVRFEVDNDCSSEFNNLMKCVGNDGKGQDCDDLYKALQVCLTAKAKTSKMKGKDSRKYHIERVYRQLGPQTKVKKGKGSKP